VDVIWLGCRLSMQLSVIPYPSIVEHVGPGAFKLPRDAAISCCAALQPQAEYLQQGLSQRFRHPTNVQQRPQDVAQGVQAPIKLQLVDDLPALWPFRWSEEGYELVCSEAGVSIAALTSTGVFYGIQTLLQALQASEEQQGLCMPHTRVRPQHPRWHNRHTTFGPLAPGSRSRGYLQITHMKQHAACSAARLLSIAALAAVGEESPP
jgi:alpha-glucuronidase